MVNFYEGMTLTLTNVQMNKALRNCLIGTSAIAACVFGTKTNANPLINNYNNSRDSFSQNVHQRNQPRNGGETTLAQKCEALDYFESRMEFGKIMSTSFQIGFEHEIGDHDIDSACRIVRRAGMYWIQTLTLHIWSADLAM